MTVDHFGMFGAYAAPVVTVEAFKYGKSPAGAPPASRYVGRGACCDGAKWHLSSLDAAIDALSRMGYVGAFLAGFLGASIPFFPSYILIPLMGIQLNPFIVGVVSGVGAGVGQYLHYYVGLGGRYLFSAQTRARFERWRVRYGKYGVWLIIALAATPLTPDDIVWIPLGLMRYPRLKALLAGMTGKTILSLVYAYAGYYGWAVIGELLKGWGLG